MPLFWCRLVSPDEGGAGRACPSDLTSGGHARLVSGPKAWGRPKCVAQRTRSERRSGCSSFAVVVPPPPPEEGLEQDTVAGGGGVAALGRSRVCPCGSMVGSPRHWGWAMNDPPPPLPSSSSRGPQQKGRKKAYTTFPSSDTNCKRQMGPGGRGKGVHQRP